MMAGLFRRTLVRRVTLGLVFAFAVLYFVLMSYVIWTARSEEADRTALRVVGIEATRSLAKTSLQGEARAMAAAMEGVFNESRRHAKVPGDMLVQIWDRHAKQMIFSSAKAGDVLLPGHPDHQTRHMLNGTRYSVFQGETPRWSFRLGEPDLTDDLADSWIWLRIGSDLMPYMLIAFPLLFFPIWFSVSRGLRPLQRLTDQIAARNADDLSSMDVAPPYEELKPLVLSLDHLLTRLRRKIEREHGFVQDAAHELRTPMAVISAQAHVLAKAADAAQRHEAVQRLEQAIARASHLIEQLLALASVDAEPGKNVAEADVAQLARQVLAQTATGAMARNVELSLEAPDALVHRLDLHAFQSILHNLVDNAVRYNNEGGRVAVTLRDAGHALLLSVADDGPGIPVPDRTLVFERFYRGAGHDASGSGLGLAIVRQAVARMGGEVDISIGLGGRGCCFSVRIPHR
jgi:two-component system sensor histidine kinase QseC